MLKFFRRIRQNLLANNRFGKYMLYAAGEILLVVVGILIAFNVNTWSEARKLRNTELKYFRNLKTDLIADIELLHEIIDLSNTKVAAARRIKKQSDALTVGSLYDFSSDMQDLIFVDEFRPNDNTYEEMKSSGNLSLIQNDNLKLKLLNLKKAYAGIQSSHEHIRYDFNVFLEDFEHYIDWGKYYDLTKSNIPQLDLVYDSTYIENHQSEMKAEVIELFKNKVFLNNIFLVEVNYAWIEVILQETILQAKEVIGIIDEEIQKG